MDIRGGIVMVDEQGNELAKCDSGADLLKAHVKGYTRNDGVFVAEHDDKRQAAQPKPESGGKSKLSAEAVNKFSDSHNLARKASDWTHEGVDAVPAADVANFPEFTHKEVYGHDNVSKTSPVATDFSNEFKEKGHQGFVVRHPDGSRHVIDTQGSGYARYSAPVKEEVQPKQPSVSANVPPLGKHAEAVRAEGKKRGKEAEDGSLNKQDEEDFDYAADLMAAGDHEALASHLKHLDTEPRDKILDHVHPDHREKLGYEQINKQRSLDQFSKLDAELSKPKPRAKKPKNDPAALRAAGDAMRAAMDKNSAEKKAAGQPEGFVPRKDVTAPSKDIQNTDKQAMDEAALAKQGLMSARDDHANFGEAQDRQHERHSKLEAAGYKKGNAKLAAGGKWETEWEHSDGRKAKTSIGEAGDGKWRTSVLHY